MTVFRQSTHKKKSKCKINLQNDFLHAGMVENGRIKAYHIWEPFIENSFQVFNNYKMKLMIFLLLGLLLLTRSEWIPSTSTPQASALGIHDSVDSYRAKIIQKNIQFIGGHNARSDTTYQMKAYPSFVALTEEEVREKYLMKVAPAELAATRVEKPLPKVSDLGKKVSTLYYVDLTNSIGTPVQNQGACGNCYAFSATDSANMNNKKAGRNIPLLSFQQLTDCSYRLILNNASNNGCGGGSVYVSMEYQRIYGLNSLSAYPQNANTYVYGTQQACSNSNGPYRISQWGAFTTTSCVDRISYLLSGYAISAYVSAGTPYWYYYSSGVLPGCYGYTTIDHAVVMVGAYYDTNSAANSYITFKNSWGINWGESGKIRISLANRTCEACIYGIIPF